MPSSPPQSCGSASDLACNLSVIVGQLITEPVRRTLPGGTALLSFSLTVRRTGAATTSVPLVWYDPPKRTLRWQLDDELIVLGSVVRRFYRAGGITASRTEVVVERAEVTRRRAATRRIAQAAFDQADRLLASLD